MKEETTFYHIFKSMEVQDKDEVPWDFIKEHYILEDSEIRLCKTIVQEELDFRQKLGYETLFYWLKDGIESNKGGSCS